MGQSPRQVPDAQNKKIFDSVNNQRWADEMTTHHCLPLSYLQVLKSKRGKTGSGGRWPSHPETPPWGLALRPRSTSLGTGLHILNHIPRTGPQAPPWGQLMQQSQLLEPLSNKPIYLSKEDKFSHLQSCSDNRCSAVSDRGQWETP